MASTSTGYNKSIITKEQPSSSGQVMSFTSGCIVNVNAGAKLNLSGKVEVNSGSTVDIESGGKLTVASGGKVAFESGSTVDVESGGYFTVASGAYFADENLTRVTTCGVYGTTVAARGTIWLQPTSSGNITIQITSPKKVGQRVLVLLENSTKHKARIVMGNSKVTVAGSSGQMLIFTTELSARPAVGGGDRYIKTGVELIALSATRYGVIRPWSTVTGNIDLSTARAS